MALRRELLAFSAVLCALVAGFLGESLFRGRVLSPADVLFVSASFRERGGPRYEPANRLLMDPVLQFQPWLEFNRAMLRQGRWPLWNDRAGCGTPHLANGQSAVFDPFHLIAYLGPLPQALAWMAALRLVTAGLGMFLLARSWGLGPWGRWFAGLCFPFCGFLVVWLLFPVTNVAVWMPWLFWATERVLKRPGPREIGVLGVSSGLVLLGGHVQTSAHVLLGAGVYGAWRSVVGWRGGSSEPISRRGLPAWIAGVLLGITLAAVEVVPLGCYLARSPVWGDRERARRPPWSLARPRVLDAACTALPYLYGSQRRGHPNVARALGVHNLNESAGGFAGLATLIWLAPLAWAVREERSRVHFLAGFVLFGGLGAFGFPPVDNLLRALPVLNVIDNRRLTLWVAFGLVLLGAIGLDALGKSRRERPGRFARILWAVGAWGCGRPRFTSPGSSRACAARASEHYAEAAATTPGAEAAVYRERAERQVRRTLAFYPRYLMLASAHLFTLTTLAHLWRRCVVGARPLRPALLGLVLVDLFGFGFGLNPAIAAGDDRPVTAVIAYLRGEVGTAGRVLALGEELPPNTLMRYGLSDLRNYDSVELSRSLTWFAPLYESGSAARTSRRAITWGGVIRARERLREAAVLAVVAPSPPPSGAFERVDRVEGVWVARLDGKPWARAESPRTGLRVEERSPGRAQLLLDCGSQDRIIMSETFDPGWRAWVDGMSAPVEAYRDTFLAVTVPAGAGG